LYLQRQLEERRGEIEKAVLIRVYAVADSSAVDDPAYLELDIALQCGDSRGSPPSRGLAECQFRHAH
jgi:hypothetical protein